MNLEQSSHEHSLEAPRKSLTPLTIAAGLRAAAEEITSGKDRKGLLKLAEALQTHNAVEGVLAEVPDLPEDLRQIVSAGVKTGRLPYLLDEYLSTSRTTRSLWRNLYFNLLYPVLIVLASLAIMVAFILIAVPQFKAIFNDFGVELPFMTRVLIGVSDFLMQLWFPLLVVGVVVVIFFLIKDVLPFARFRAQVFQALPWVGTAQRMAAAAEFSSRLAILVECRIPLDEALQIVSNSIRDPYMSHIAGRVAVRLEAGDAPEDVASYGSGLPHPLSNAFRWSGDPGAFADGLRSLAIVFAAQARLSTGQLIVITEPLGFIMVAVLAGTIVSSMFLPLVRLLNELS